MLLLKHIYELVPVSVVNGNYFCRALLGMFDLTHLDNIASNTLQVFMTPSELYEIAARSDSPSIEMEGCPQLW